jgi:hypothetical protein
MYECLNLMNVTEHFKGNPSDITTPVALLDVLVRLTQYMPMQSNRTG